MNFKSCKALKTISILLLSLEFLAPTFLSDLLPTEKSVLYQRHILNIAKQRNPILYFNEETDDEVRQREVQSQKTSRSVTNPIALPCVIRPAADKGLTLQLPGHHELHFDTQPPLFTLHRLLLL